MSLGLDLGTKPEGTTAQMVNADHIWVGEIDMSCADFCQLVIYVLTNVDLVANDPRLHLMNQLAKLNVIPGHNEGGYRIG